MKTKRTPETESIRRQKEQLAAEARLQRVIARAVKGVG